MYIDDIFPISVIITLLGIAIIYFGKNIIKARKELCRDWTSNVLEGIFFIIVYIIFPLLIIILLSSLVIKGMPQYIFTNLERTTKNIVLSLLTIINLLIFQIQDTFMFKIKRFVNGLIVFFSILVSFVISFIDKSYIFVIGSFLITFLVFTYASIIYGLNIKPANYTQLVAKIPQFKIIKRQDKKEDVICKIVKIGEDFIEVVTKEDFKKYETEFINNHNAKLKSTLINKSEIKSIENFE